MIILHHVLGAVLLVVFNENNFNLLNDCSCADLKQH